MKVEIYGSSDDLIEVEGDIREEFNAPLETSLMDRTVDCWPFRMGPSSKLSTAMRGFGALLPWFMGARRSMPSRKALTWTTTTRIV